MMGGLDGYGDVLTDFSDRQREALQLPPVAKGVWDKMPECQVNRSVPCREAGA